MRVWGLFCVLLHSVLVLGQTYTFTSSSQHVVVIEGTDVTLDCSFNRLDNINVMWLHDMRALTFNTQAVSVDPHYSVSSGLSLTVRNVTSRDEGEYLCQGGTFPTMTQVNTITVHVPPEIEQFPVTNDGREIEATLGDAVHLTCAASGKPAPNVTWSKKELANDPDWSEVALLTSVSNSTLALENLQASDAGIYICRADNGLPPAVRDELQLTVFYPPSIFNTTEVVYTGPGREVSLPCLVRAHPDPRVTWLQNGSAINLRDMKQSREIVVEELNDVTGYSLHIKQVTDKDLGKYACHVTNSKGEASTELTLTAIPGKPVIVSDSKGEYSNSYTLQWSVLSYVTPVNYDIMLLKDGAWDDISEKPTSEGSGVTVHNVSLTLTGLDPDMTYQVMVTAHNAYGYGEQSDPHMFHTSRVGMTPPAATTPPSTSTANTTSPTFGDDNGDDEFPASGGHKLKAAVLLAAVCFILTVFV